MDGHPARRRLVGERIYGETRSRTGANVAVSPVHEFPIAEDGTEPPSARRERGFCPAPEMKDGGRWSRRGSTPSATGDRGGSSAPNGLVLARTQPKVCLRPRSAWPNRDQTSGCGPHGRHGVVDGRVLVELVPGGEIGRARRPRRQRVGNQANGRGSPRTRPATHGSDSPCGPPLGTMISIGSGCGPSPSHVLSGETDP